MGTGNLLDNSNSGYNQDKKAKPLAGRKGGGLFVGPYTNEDHAPAERES